jgi:hypothetical protein
MNDFFQAVRVARKEQGFGIHSPGERRDSVKYKILSLFLIFTLISLGGCQKKKESEKKEAPKKVAGGYVINFKPNDSMDLVPPKTIILQPAGRAEGENTFYLAVAAKGIDSVSQVSFDLTFDPASVSYLDFKPGELFEQKGKVEYKIGPKGDQKGKLEVKISFGSGGPVSGTGKLATLSFKALQPGRGDMLFENGEMIDGQKKKVSETNWVGGLLWVLETG